MKRTILIMVLLIAALGAKASDTTQTKVIVLQFNNDSLLFNNELQYDGNKLDSMLQILEFSLDDATNNSRKFEIYVNDFEKKMNEIEKEINYRFKDLDITVMNTINSDSLSLYLDSYDFDNDSNTIDLNQYFQIKTLDSIYQLLNNQSFSLEADGFFNILYTPSDSSKTVKISADSEIIDQILVEEAAENGKNVLKIHYKDGSVSSPNPPTILLNTNNLQKIDINGASTFHTKKPIQAKNFTVNASGAANIVIDGTIDHLTTDASGASSIVYSGHAKNHTIHSSGAANVYASKQTNDTATLSASGVSKIKVYVKDKIKSQKCNSYASIIVLGKPETYTDKEVTVIYRDSDGQQIIHTQDTSKFKLLGFDFSNFNDEHYEIGMGSHVLITDGDHVYIKSRKGKKFNGHWGGIELGINGYNTPAFNMDFPKEYEYLDLRTSKSITFHLNLIEFNIPFTKRSRTQKWGMVTGLGYEVHNYRLQSNVFLCPDSSTLKGYIAEGGLPVKSKLLVDYLTVPVLFEFQTKKFHVNLGGIFGLRLTTHSKMKFESPNETVYLNDPETGKSVATLNPKNKIYKQHNDFHLNPIKLDARFSIGYSILNVFVDYSLINMFKANHGPQLYPWTIGITLLGW